LKNQIRKKNQSTMWTGLILIKPLQPIQRYKLKTFWYHSKSINLILQDLKLKKAIEKWWKLTEA